jgi:subtilisin family serine protease
MSKSKSKSKSKQASFPDQYWRPEFEIYTYYPALFDHGKELLAVEVRDPPEDGDVIASEVGELLTKQQELNDHFDERERRREEIEWEADHLARNYQTTLLTGPDAYPKTWQLMNTMSDLALMPVMHFKKRFARARPSQIEPRIAPLLEVPGHPAYPSGHSTQNFLIAHLLSEVIGDDAELIARVFAIARRVAENREYAGLHYASDTQAGEDLARDIFPIMRQALAEPIKAAIEEWQELELEEDDTGARQEQAVAMYGLHDAPAPMNWDDPFPKTHFRQHQWNLQNRGQRGGRSGVDINVLDAWKELKIWHGGAAPKEPVRVALIDMAIDFHHPALQRRFDLEGAVNLDYPSSAKDDEAKYKETFRSFSSAHGIACAGIIAADRPELVWVTKDENGKPKHVTEPGCLGIAPHCEIVPYRAMTLTEPVLHKRQALARAVLQATTGYSFVASRPSAPNGSATGWKIAEKRRRPAQVLLFPLPLEPLLAGSQDPLPLALAFAATKMPVIIPSGNKGTSSLSYPSESIRRLQIPDDIRELSKLFDLDLASVRAIFGDQTPPEQDDEKIIKDLSSLREGVPIIYVGACNDQGRRSRYSQYGAGLTLVAPSDEVMPLPQHLGNGARRPPSIATTDLQGIGGYMQDQNHYTLADNEFGFGGTSAAAAQVVGVVALMLQKNPELLSREVYEILCETARFSDGKRCFLETDDGSALEKGRHSAEFGYGLVDAAGAVAKVPAPRVAAA